MTGNKWVRTLGISLVEVGIIRQGFGSETPAHREQVVIVAGHWTCVAESPEDGGLETQFGKRVVGTISGWSRKDPKATRERAGSGQHKGPLGKRWHLEARRQHKGEQPLMAMLP